MITVNSVTRQFNVPGSDLVFGVSGDSDVERKHFQCPRYVGDGLDLAACFIRMNYRNANGAMDFYLVDDLAIDGDNITFSWLLSPRVTEYKGQVKFVMCAVGPDLKLKWHTTQGTGQVMDGLEPDNSHVESQTADVVAQLIAMVDAQTVAVEKVGAEQVANVNATAETATMAAVNEIEAKRANSLASIPNDYTSLSSAVESLTRGKAVAIVCDAEGSAVAVSDASDMPIQGMRIFGRSTQDGVPSPEAPAEIVSVENPVVTVGGKNLFPNHVTDYVGDNGTTVKVNADGSITVHKVAGAGLSFRATVYFPAGTYVLSSGLDEGHVIYLQAFEVSTNGAGSRVVQWNGGETGVYLFSRDVAEGDVTLFPQIELGSVATAYEPYKPIQTIETAHPLRGIPVIDGGNYTDANGQQWICDEVDLERGVYVQRTDIKIFNGTETTWRMFPQVFAFVITWSGVSGGWHLHHAMASHFECSTEAYNGTPGHFAIDQIGLCYFATGHQTLDEFKEWLVSNPVTVVCKLAAPIETPLSEAEIAAYRNLHSNYPNTTVLNDAGAPMVVKYAADTKLYIDNKIKEALK